MTYDTLTILAGFICGLLAGAVYFASLWRTTRTVTQTGQLQGALMGAALRLGAVLGLLGLALWLGAPALAILAGLVGFIAARLAATRLARRGPQKG